ncbi:hypothetical protein [Devosia sp. Leaf420]|uniref:hypothetical protein n=1 Tax=Devosia sp. Leaf420 TaxID=1736374 RepID=UPI000AC84666|nr:hypothetical protein [Devosia sp. Leaf420]
MSLPPADRIRLPFITQRPSDGGCGLYVLQMLTGKPFDDLVAMVDWRDRGSLHMTWAEMNKVLADLGLPHDVPHAVNTWDDVEGLAIVHVADDHFMLYDADNQVFYDPWEWTGPSTQSTRLPFSFVHVMLPNS